MTIIIKPSNTDLIQFNIANVKNRKINGFLKLFRKIMKHENVVRSRRNSMLNTNEDLFKIRDFDKFYGRPINERVNYKSQKQLRNVKKVKDNSSALKVIYHSLDTYCDNTTLHGLRYVGNSSLTVLERIFWLLAFSCAVCFAGYFIRNIYDKYNNSPVIISFNPTAAPLNAIPFPAVTICNLNQAVKKKAEIIVNTGTEIENKLLDDYCNSNSSFTNASTPSDDMLTNWEVVSQFIGKISQPCHELIKLCQWRQIDVDCAQLFTTFYTDDGMCCTFNRLPNNLIFRNLKDVEEDINNSTLLVEDWNPQKGFSSEVPSNTTPFRSPGAGSHLGLTIVADAALDEYYCSSTVSTGFKVLLSNPIETPKMADFGFLISPGREARIVIEPSISDATPTLQTIDVSKRQCFFASERYLKYYRTYTERNCHLECQSNYTQKKCGCVPYFLPRNKKTKICGKQQDRCSNEAKSNVIMESQISDMNCNCLPGCFELGYSKSTSFGVLSNKFKIKESILGKEDLNYFVENMAVLHFYYEKSQFTKHTKSEIYGFTEFLSNTGGLLGLFLGFSFLSAVELGYYLSLKMLCNYIRLRKKNRIAKREQLYPFTK